MSRMTITEQVYVSVFAVADVALSTSASIIIG